MFSLLIALFALAGLSPANAQVGVEISLPSISIGINLPIYPKLVLLPGSPVYYAPRAHSNYFFYDGLYWVYSDDNWYSSDWYNGPWQVVGPQYVPLFILRVPVRYYRQPPSYFRGWRTDAPPRWGEHWGNDWEGQRQGWNQWNRQAVPRAAPLPAYQRQYWGNHYPGTPERQQAIRSEHYRYQPREAITQEHFRRPVQRAQPAPEAQRPATERLRQNTEPRQAPPDRPHDRPGEASRPEKEARPPRPFAPQAEPRQQAPIRQPAPPPESRPAAAEQGRPGPAMQRQPGNAPDGRREQERGGGQSEHGRDNNRNDERGPDRRQ